MFEQPSYVAGGDINPGRFITPTADSVASQASDPTSILIGISALDSEFPPGTAADTGLLATIGQQFRWYGPGFKCKVIASGALAANIWLTCDADGKAAAAVATNCVAAISVQAATAEDEAIDAWVISPFIL